MKSTSHLRRRARRMRKIRKIHRLSGLYILVFFLIISVSGLLLAWKKNSGGVLSIPTQEGTTSQMDQWMPLEDLNTIACEYYSHLFPGSDEMPERIDVRPGKGVIKFVFSQNYYEIQIDASNGKILSTGYRVADIIENIHDGSIIDRLFRNEQQLSKLIYSSLLSLASLCFAITGFWLWNERRKIRRGFEK